MKAAVAKIILFVLLLLTNSCFYVNEAFYNPYKFASQSPSSFYFSEEIKKEFNTSPPEMPKKEQTYTLAEIIDIALKNNPDTSKSWAIAQRAAANYGQKQASYFPTISGEATAFRSKLPFLTRDSEGDRKADSTLDTRIHPKALLTYTILDFGRRRWTTEFTRYSLYFSNWSHNRTLQTVVRDVSNFYYFYVFEKKLQEAIYEDIVTAQTTLDAVNNKKTDGNNHNQDLLQARTELFQRRATYEGQKQKVEDAVADLLNSMGLSSDVDIDLELISQTPFTDFSVKNITDLVNEALDQRPDLKAAKAAVMTEEAAIQLAYSRFFPSLFYQVDYGRTYFKKWISGKNDWSSTFFLSIPLFSGLSQVNALRKAKLKKKEILAKLREKELTISREIRISRSEVEVARDTLKITIEFLEAAKKQYNSALQKYERNQSSILDVVSAQNSLSNGRARYARAIQRWYSALANLTFAIGSYTFTPDAIHEFCLDCN